MINPQRRRGHDQFSSRSILADILREESLQCSGGGEKLAIEVDVEGCHGRFDESFFGGRDDGRMREEGNFGDSCVRKDCTQLSALHCTNLNDD